MTAKWDGKNTYQLREKMRMIGENARALRRMETLARDMNYRLEQEIKKELVRLIGRDDLDWQYIERGYSWDCPTSPTEHCIYDISKDPVKDFCLFCGEPVDRG